MKIAPQHIVVGDGCRIAYRFDGPVDKPLLLLSNSLGTDMSMWDAQLEVFAQRYRVLRYDSRGHGESDAPAGGYSIDRLGRDVIELLDALKLDRGHFCGLSKGGMIGQWLAHRAPERLNRLVLANTSPYMGPPSAWQDRIASVRTHGIAPVVDASIDRWFSSSFSAANEHVVAPVRAVLEAIDPTGYIGCCAAIRDMDQRATARLNDAPTLVIVGTEDIATRPDAGIFLAEQARQAALYELSAAHLSNVEASEEFSRIVCNFLAA